MDLEEEKRREALGKQVLSDLLEIARLNQQPIKQMLLNEYAVFEEVNNPICDSDYDLDQ